MAVSLVQVPVGNDEENDVGAVAATATPIGNGGTSATSIASAQMIRTNLDFTRIRIPPRVDAAHAKHARRVRTEGQGIVSGVRLAGGPALREIAHVSILQPAPAALRCTPRTSTLDGLWQGLSTRRGPWRGSSPGPSSSARASVEKHALPVAHPFRPVERVRSALQDEAERPRRVSRYSEYRSVLTESRQDCLGVPVRRYK
jgi:hypothetical protein